LGPGHDATVKCTFRRACNFMQKEEFEEALVLLSEWEEILFERAQALCDDDTHAAAKALFQMFQFKTQKASCLEQFDTDHLRLRAEKEFLKAAEGLYNSSNIANDAFVKTMNLFGIFMANHTDSGQHFLEELWRTCRSSQLWKRAMLVVQKAVEVLLAEVGQNDILTENMRRNLLVSNTLDGRKQMSKRTCNLMLPSSFYLVSRWFRGVSNFTCCCSINLMARNSHIQERASMHMPSNAHSPTQPMQCRAGKRRDVRIYLLPVSWIDQQTQRITYASVYAVYIMANNSDAAEHDGDSTKMMMMSFICSCRNKNSALLTNTMNHMNLVLGKPSCDFNQLFNTNCVGAADLVCEPIMVEGFFRYCDTQRIRNVNLGGLLMDVTNWAEMQLWKRYVNNVVEARRTHFQMLTDLTMQT
jgi:hypothetical protein